jgi:hypothetical protein
VRLQLTVARLRLVALVAAALVTTTNASAQPDDATPESPDVPAPEPAPPVEPPGAEPTPPPIAPPAAEAKTETPSAIDVRASTQLAGYADSDHVYVVSPTIAGSLTNPTAGWSVDGRYLVDVVSAASVDIVSTASRRWEEVRHVGSLGGLYKPGEWGVGANADVSIEPDYQSYTFAGSVQRDILDKNATLLLGYEHGHDISGRSGTPFSVFSRKIDHDAFKGGATFVLDKATILSTVGDLVVERGDTSKPYRYVPMFAPGVDVAKGASVVTVDQLRLPARVLEQLPTARTRYALAGHLAHRFAHSTLRVSERLYTDSWGLRASSTDLRLIVDLGERADLGPHVRFHAQTPVVFWQRAYVMQPQLDFPALRTGDRELGPLASVTGGASFHVAVGSARTPRSWVLGLELNGTQTQYLDDLYIKSRLSAISVLSLEAEF